MPKVAPLDKKEVLHTFLLVMLYGIGFYCLQIVLYRIGMFSSYPTHDSLISWDAGWYRDIARRGYAYSNIGQSNSGFFYLFPAIWKLTGFNGVAISLLNMSFFAAGLSVLAGMFKPDIQHKMLWVSMPAVMFAFVPYAEAVYFLLGAVCLYGISAQRTWLIVASLFLLSLTRATAIFVVPAFLCMEVLSCSRKDIPRNIGRYLLLYILPSAAGLATFVFIQYQATGVWFAYFIAQSTFWRRIYSAPILPFYNGVGYHTILLNALAIFACLTAFVMLIFRITKWLARGEQQDKVLVVSLAYLTTTLFSSLFYSPLWLNGATDVIGTFRYTMMTPFFYVFLNHVTRNTTYKWQHYVIVFLFATGVWMAFGAYAHLQELLFFSFNTVVILLFMACSSRKLEWPAIALTLINFLFQMLLFQHFIGRTSLVD